jgi:hypothetical protein
LISGGHNHLQNGYSLGIGTQFTFHRKFANEVMDDEQQKVQQCLWADFWKKSQKSSGNEKAGDLTAENLEAVLALVPKLPKEDKQEL